MRRRALRAALVFAGFALSLVFGYLALRGVKLHATWRALRASNAWWLAPALAALAGCVFLRVVRWQLLFRPGRRPSFGSLAKAALLGFFFNSILPARAGEAARIVALKHYEGTSRAEATATVVVERIVDVMSLLVLLFAFLAWFPRVSWLTAAGIVAGACLLVVAALAAAVRYLQARPLPAVRLLARLPGLREVTVQRLTQNTLHGLGTLVSPRQAVGVLVWTFASWFVLGLSFWALMAGFDLHLSPLAGLLVVIATGLAFIIPAAPAAVGVFEAAGLTGLSAYGVPRSHAFAYVLVLHLLNFFPFVAAGLVLLAREARRPRPGPAEAAAVRSRR
jgi:glycosyltransferase 2 family protein